MIIINEFIKEYGATIIHTVLTGIITYFGYHIKKILSNYSMERIKKDTTLMVCRGVEELYSNLSTEDKINNIINNLRVILNEKGIKQISDLELKMLVVNSLSELHENNMLNCLENKN